MGGHTPTSTFHNMSVRSATSGLLRLAWATALGLALLARTGGAQGTGQGAKDDLSAQATDPTAPLTQINFISDVRFSYHDVDGTGHEFRFQPVLPFRAFGVGNLMRVIVPYQTGGPGSVGLKDVSIFDIVVTHQKWGRLALGAVASLSPSSVAPFGIGPAVGVIIPQSKKLMFGVFSQNLFGTDKAISQLQPIFAYQLGNAWSLTAGDLQFTYDWNQGEFVLIPLGFQVGVVRSVAKQPFRFAVNPQWNVRDKAGTPDVKVVFTVTLLSPVK